MKRRCNWERDTFDLAGGGFWDGFQSAPGFKTECGMWVGGAYYHDMKDKSVCDTCGRKIEMISDPPPFTPTQTEE